MDAIGVVNTNSIKVGSQRFLTGITMPDLTGPSSLCRGNALGLFVYFKSPKRLFYGFFVSIRVPPELVISSTSAGMRFLFMSELGSYLYPWLEVYSPPTLLYVDANPRVISIITITSARFLLCQYRRHDPVRHLCVNISTYFLSYSQSCFSGMYC